MLRATQSRLEVLCVSFGRWERSRHLREEAMSDKRGKSPISRPNDLCGLQKMSPFVFFLFVLFNSLIINSERKFEFLFLKIRILRFHFFDSPNIL